MNTMTKPIELVLTDELHPEWPFPMAVLAGASPPIAASESKSEDDTVLEECTSTVSAVSSNNSNGVKNSNETAHQAVDRKRRHSDQNPGTTISRKLTDVSRPSAKRRR